MVIYIQKYDVIPDKHEAWQQWSQTAIQALLKVPGIIDFSAHRPVAGVHQVAAIYSFATLEDWARWVNDPAMQKLYEEIYHYVTNHTTELWNSSPVIQQRLQAIS